MISWEVSSTPNPLGIRRSKSGGIVNARPMVVGSFAVNVSESHPAIGVTKIGGIAAVKYASPTSQPGALNREIRPA